MTNAELLEKAAITTAALAAAGKLNPVQSKKFLDFVIDETVAKGNARIVRVKTDWELHKMGLGKRSAVPAEEGKDPGIRRGITTSKVVVTPKKIMLPFEISEEFFEENIEGESVETTVIRLMATQLANELEELWWMGDALGEASLESDLIDGGDAARYVKDSYLGMFDGVLKLADVGNIFDAAGANIGTKVFGGMIRKLPTKFRRQRSKLRFFVSPDLEQLWRERLSTRGTALGDVTLQSDGSIKAFGIPLVAVPLMTFLPRIVQHTGNIADAGTFNLRYKPVTADVVTQAALAAVPATKLGGAGVDYTLDAATGVITNEAAGLWVNNTSVKVTYDANPQALLTHAQNMIWAIGRDIKIKKAEDIFRDMRQYAITVKLGCQLEETDALVKGINIGQGV